MKRNRTKPEDFLPLGQTDYCILSSLIGGPKHGYAIMADIEQATNGAVRVATGNLYVSLKKLLDDGLIEKIEAPVGVADRRTTYRILGLGERVCEAERRRLEMMLGFQPGVVTGTVS